MKSCVFIALLVVAACAEDSSVQYLSELELQAHKHFKLLVNSMVDGRTEFLHPRNTIRSLSHFSYDNCGKPKSEVLVVKDINVKPDPIKLPGTLNISGEFNITKKFGSPLTASLKVYKKFLGLWIKVPCIDDVGSCTYKDFCPRLKKIVKKCPPELVKQGFDCTCPFKADHVKFTDLLFSADVKLPSIASGEIKVEIELTSGNTYITCVKIEADLKS